MISLGVRRGVGTSVFSPLNIAALSGLTAAPTSRLRMAPGKSRAGISRYSAISRSNSLRPASP